MFKEFEETGDQVRKAVPFILPTVSYIVASLVLASLFKIIIDIIGNISFALSTIGTVIGLPTFIAIWDRMSGASILETFTKNWSQTKPVIHLLIIFDALIYFGLYNSLVYKTLWPTQTEKN